MTACKPEYTIEPWGRGHEVWLRSALTRFLEAGLARGADTLPTPHNVEILLGLGLALARRGDPCLLAVANCGPVAYVEWGDPQALHPPGERVELRWRTCQTFGSFTEPEWRHRGVAGALRAEAKRIVIAHGYERITGAMDLTNPRGIEEMVLQGGWPVHMIMETLV